jgi:hypothetical protein
MLSVGLSPSSSPSSGVAVAEYPGSDTPRTTGMVWRPVKAPTPKRNNFAWLRDGRAVAMLFPLLHRKEAAAGLVLILLAQH